MFSHKKNSYFILSIEKPSIHFLIARNNMKKPPWRGIELGMSCLTMARSGQLAGPCFELNSYLESYAVFSFLFFPSSCYQYAIILYFKYFSIFIIVSFEEVDMNSIYVDSNILTYTRNYCLNLRIKYVNRVCINVRIIYTTKVL